MNQEIELRRFLRCRYSSACKFDILGTCGIFPMVYKLYWPYAAICAAIRKGGDSNHVYEFPAESYFGSESDRLLQPWLAPDPIFPRTAPSVKQQHKGVINDRTYE